jgi:hypothetical protein
MWYRRREKRPRGRADRCGAGLRIARANLKLLVLELGDVIEPAPKPTKHEDDLPGPSLAEILLERLSEIEVEDAREQGRPAPAPMSADIIAQAKAEGRLNDLLLDCLELVEPPDNKSAVPPGLEQHGGAPSQD